MHPAKVDCLDAYLHAICCDDCTERLGDAIQEYGQQLLAAVTYLNPN